MLTKILSDFKTYNNSTNVVLKQWSVNRPLYILLSFIENHTYTVAKFFPLSQEKVFENFLRRKFFTLKR